MNSKNNMLTLKQRRSVVVALMVLLALALFLLWFFLFRAVSVVLDEDEEFDIPASEVRDVTPASSSIVPVTPDGANARIVATNFVERFGTYSTDVPFMNVTEVREITTPEYYSTLNELRAGAVDSDEFFGMTVRVLSVTPMTGSEETGSVTYEVSAQLEAQVGSRANSNVTYKKGTINVVKRGESWLVSSFEWIL